jgi:hypothetical protein
MGDSRFVAYHGITPLMDWIILVCTFGLGVYTTILAVSTINFVRQKSSLIDYMKKDRWQSNPRRY